MYGEFSISGKNVIREYFLNDYGYPFMRVVYKKSGKFIWCNTISRIHYARALETYRKVALLDNGDITSSNE